MTEHQALYRKWRPQRFADVVNQAYAVRTLVNALSSGEINHAYLFAGPRGTGKTTVARLFAKAVNCLEPQGGEPCNACDACARIGRGASLDVVEVDGASNRGIDQIRKLREEVNFVPGDVRYKVYIIDEVHMLTNEAFNALLKTLEEPPKRVVFIFATTEPHKLPPTVTSRCQAYEFTRITPELIAAHLAKVCEVEGIRADERALAAVADRAGGALRDALVTLEQVAAYASGEAIDGETLETVLGLPSESVLAAFLEALLSGDAEATLRLLGEQTEHGRDLELFLEELIRLSRRWLVASVRGRELPVEASLAELARLTEHLLELKREMGRVWDKQIWLEVGALQFVRGPAPASQLAAISPTPVADRPPPPARAAKPTSPKPAESAADTPPPAADKPEGPPARASRPTSLEARWEALLEAIRNERVAVYAYLVEGSPRLEEDTLHVRYHPEHRFHKESLDKPQVRDYVLDKVKQVFGERVRLTIDYGDDNDTPPAGESPPASAGPESASKLEDAVRLVEDVLEGKPVSR